MEEKLKNQINLLFEGKVPVEGQPELFLRLSADSEAKKYLYNKARKKDPEIERAIIENQRSAYCQELLDEYGEFIPASAYAADDGNNLCDFECESYLLHQFGVETDPDKLAMESKNNYWLRNEGTPLFNMGKLLEQNGLYVSRIFDGNLDKLCDTLNTCKVIAVVNGDILVGKVPDILSADFNPEDSPNHAVVVESVSIASDIVTIFNPALEDRISNCSIATFLEAWSESKNYMLSVRHKKHEFEYCPQPIDTSCVTLNNELIELVEFLSENAHNVWASSKMAKGYSYGPDDDTHNHFLKPYHLLTEIEKDQDRDNVLSTIKVLKRLGYRLVNINNMHRCPYCGEGIEPSNNFCPCCGKELTWEDFK